MLGDKILMFDPFENRISRDIRNRLSREFLQLIVQGNWPDFEKKATALKQLAPDMDHRHYIEARLKDYQKIYGHRARSGPFEIARHLWHHNLFFECHEWLEPLWLDADGSFKKAIQGIIRAAGAHVLAEAGLKAGSQASALKALVLIQDHRAEIPGEFDADELITALHRLID